jgi:hypothetical protein
MKLPPAIFPVSSGVNPPRSIAARRCYPLRIVLQTPGPDLLIRADTDVLDADDIDQLFYPVDVLVQAGEEVARCRPSHLSRRRSAHGPE